MNRAIHGRNQERLTTNISWYHRTFSQLKLSTPDGRQLRFAHWKQPDSRATVIIVTGRTEYIEKYIDTVRDLQDGSLSFAIYDHCGQGDSGRLLADAEKGHVDRFDRYVDDLHQIVTASRDIFGSGPLHLLCHSMGATIAWLYYARHGGSVDSLILASPMFSIETGFRLPPFVIESVVELCCRSGMGERYAVTTGPFDPDLPFAGNVLTTDPERFSFNLHMARELPHARIGGPTYRWMHEAFKAMRRARSTIAAVDCPVHVLEGVEDRVVGTADIERMAAAAVNGSLTRYERARHELFMEVPETRSRVLENVRRML